MVAGLQAHGVDTVFCVAGESYLPVLDALLDALEIKVITCRQESGATFMAEAYAQLTGKPGVAFVTRGPGACNASIGIHTAKQSSVPVILFVGLINSMDRDREAFQEFDLPQMFGSLSKWSSVIDRAERVGEYVMRAFTVSMAGRPGPVVLGLPEEVLTNKVETQRVRSVPLMPVSPDRVQMAVLEALLERVQRPLMIVGGSLWSDKLCSLLGKSMELDNIPVASALRRQDIIDHNSGSYIGELSFGPNPKLLERIKSADMIIAVGERLDEITMQGYTLIEKAQKLVHVYPAAEEFGKAHFPHMAIQAHPESFIHAFWDMKLKSEGWKQWRDEARQDYLDWTAIKEDFSAGWKGADMHQVFRQLRDLLPPDAIVTTDAGNFSGWAQRYLRYARPGRKLAPVSGAMGYAVPSAVAAAIQYPDRVSLGICGDGGFMMTGQELATALHHKVKPIIMVCNNSMYGTIRMHQEREYPGRTSGTALTNPDFVKLGESYGAFAARVSDAREFPAVWETALASGRAALIEIVMDPRQISTQSKP